MIRFYNWIDFNDFYLGSKEEILANLANFGYDPINYGHFRKLNVLDLFMGKERNIIFFYRKFIFLRVEQFHFRWFTFNAS